MTQLSDCARLLRQHDYDRFLTGLFAPAARREDLYALYAFNLEIARTREAVTEPMLGRIRLQWWRETIQEIVEGSVRRHEVAVPLADAIRRWDLPRGSFDALIDAREADLDDVAPATLTALTEYARETGGRLLGLAGHLLAAEGEENAPAVAMVPDAALEATGTAYALSGILRAVPFHARAKRQYLPVDLMQASGVCQSDYFELRPVAPLAEVCRAVADAARSEIARAREAAASVAPAAMPVLVHARLAELYLDGLARNGHQPMTEQRPPGALRKQWTVYRAVKKRRY